MRRNLTRTAGIALVAAMALALGACSGGGGESDAEASTGDGDEVFAEPADDPGTDPFTDSVAAVTGRADAAVAAATPVGDGTEGIPGVSGTTPGLYGGTGTNACDADALAAFLRADDAKAAAWAEVQGITPEDIPAFVADLTPVVLLHDTRVTNHGYRAGHATPRQSVLQAGTAVLVDATGMPRARCACGNPLAEPTPVTDVVYVGDPWDGFDEDELVVPVPGEPVEGDTPIVTTPLPGPDVPEPAVNVPAQPGQAAPDTPSTTVAPDSGTPINVDPGCAARAQDLIRDTAAAGLGPEAIDRTRPLIEQIQGSSYEEQLTLWCQVVDELEDLLGI